MKSYIWIGIIIIALIALMSWSVGGGNLEPPLQVSVIHPLDNVKGNIDSSIVVVEYSDFGCPACRTYHLVIKELAVEFGDRAAFVYRHFPLHGLDANSGLAARAAQAASRQDKFWEMHDLLFEKQDEWAEARNVEPLFESYAVLLGISVEQFKKDWKSREIRKFIEAQRSHAIKSGLRGTPTFFINGEIIQNPNSVEEFRALIKEAIKNNQ